MKTLKITIVILLLSTSAWAYKIQKIESVNNPWFMDVFKGAQSHLINSAGVCGNFQGHYSYALDADDQQIVGVAAMIIRDAIYGAYLGDLDVITTSHIFKDDADFLVKAQSAISSPLGVDTDFGKQLTAQIVSHLPELDQSVELYGGSVALARNAEYKHDLINYFALVDLEKQEFFYIGSGQCEF